MSAPAASQPAGGLPAFANVTIDAARHPAVPGPDPRVAIAFVLGWQMAELYRPDRRPPRQPAFADDLPGLSRLGGREVFRLGVDQLTSGLAALAPSITQAGLALPNFAVLTADGGDLDGERLRRAIVDLHVELLLVLTATNFRLGKAYGLGRALADTCRKSADAASLRAELDRYRVATLRAWLDELGSALPPHAGHSVSSSLALWSDWIATQGDALAGDETVRTLRAQGKLWRALLSGEKLGTDMLDTKNYLDAASGLLKRIRGVLLRSMVRFPLLWLLVAVLFVGGVVLILSVHTKASIAAGLGGILASLGISWKGLAGSVGKVVAKLEQPLWGAELDAAIVDAITLLPGNKRDHRNRRKFALQAAATRVYRDSEPAIQQLDEPRGA